jgi:hypothetical protein
MRLRRNGGSVLAAELRRSVDENRERRINEIRRDRPFFLARVSAAEENRGHAGVNQARSNAVY